MLNLDENDDLLQGMDPSGYDQSYEEQAQAYGGPAQVAVREAEPLLDAFGVTTSKSQERSCFGHKETIFGVTFSECGKFCATAGQDSTINVWDVEANSLLSSLKEHSKDFECLRVAWASPRWAMDALDRTKGDFCHLLATSGADGTVRLWGCSDPMKKDEWKCHVLLDHATFLGRSDKESSQEAKEEAKEEEGQKDDKPQVYSLQFIDHWKGFTSHQNSGRLNSFLMTSSDDYAHFWEVDVQPSEQSIHLEADKISLLADKIELKEVMSLHFASIEHYGYGVTACSITDSGLKLPSATSLQGDNNTFGGERNPDNVVFVFDAAYCDANGLFGAALSDGTLRLVNGRGVCISILNLPGCQSHLTSFCWDKTGTRLATSVATGHLITWHLDIDNVQGQGQGQTVATCSAIMEGGHEPGRPLFGSRFCGERENLLVSWGVDGRLCLWDSYLLGNVNSPLAILKYDSEYPIYAVELSKNYVAIGGGSEGGFVGVPLYLYSFQLPMSGGDDQQRTESNSSNGFEVTKDDDPAIGSENVNATDQNLESDSKATDSKIENNPPPDKKLMADDTEESTKNHVVDTERVK